MRVAVCRAPGSVVVEERRGYEVRAGEVLVKVAYCGVCPSDVRVYAGLSDSAAFPTLLGHECAGVVAQVGGGVTGIAVGDRVALDPTRRCGRCDACRRGFENACEFADYSNGAFAEYTLTWPSNVYRLDDATPLESAAFAEPLACVVRGIRRARIEAGDRVLIVGAGPIGLLHLQLAKAGGAHVVVSESLAARQETATRFGADLAVHPDELIERRSDDSGRRFDVAIVAVGNVQAAERAASLLAHGGRLLLFAGFYPPKPIAVAANDVHYRELEVIGSFDCTRRDFERALRLIEQQRIDVTGLISHRFPLDRLQEAFECVRSIGGLKVMVEVDTSLENQS